VGIYLIMENPFSSKKEEVKKEVLLFANFKPENQVKIEISYDKKNVLLKKKNDKWLLIKNEKDYPADEKAVKEVLDKVKNFNKKDIISKNPKKQKLFEVTKGKGVEVKIFDKNNKMTAHFFVGKAAPDFFSTYVRKEGSSEVVVAKGYLPSVFKKEVNDWRDKQIFKFDKENVAKISIKSKEKEIVLIKADTGKWNIVKPEKMKAEKKKVYEFLREISDLKAISFPDEEITEEKAGLNKPEYTIKLDLITNKKHTLLIGKKTKDTRYYVKSDTSPYIMLLSEYMVKELTPDIKELKVKKEKKENKKK